MPRRPRDLQAVREALELAEHALAQRLDIYNTLALSTVHSLFNLGK